MAQTVELSVGDHRLDEPVFDGKVYFSKQGNPNGPKLLFVHGLGDEASSVWDESIEKLSEDYLLISFDLPGFGQSSKNNALYSPENYVHLIRYLSTNYIGAPFHLVGHSMGAAISLRYAATYPDDVTTLTLVDAAGILYRLAYTKYLAPLGLTRFLNQDFIEEREISSWTGLLLDKAEGLVQFDPEYLVRVPALRQRILRGNPATISGLALVLDDFSEVPQRVKAPTQIIWGENDQVAPLRTAYVLDSLIENSDLQIIPGAGHVPMHDKPQQFHNYLIAGMNTNKHPAKELNSVSSPSSANLKSMSCEGKSGAQFSGRINQLRIRDCRNVLIRDAQIDHLFIDRSLVALENVEIDAIGTAVEINHSDVTITAGSISGNTAIEVNDSRVDIAGTQLNAQHMLIFAPLQQSTFTFSLVPTSSPDSEAVLHGQLKLYPNGHF